MICAVNDSRLNPTRSAIAGNRRSDFQWCETPPSTSSVWPDMKALSSEARKSKAPVRSEGNWSRCTMRDAILEFDDGFSCRIC